MRLRGSTEEPIADRRVGSRVDGRPGEREGAVEDRLIALAYQKDLPLVATNDVHFATEDMYEANDALLCIADGTYIDVEDRRRLTREHRFKSAEEMAALFADVPEAVANSSPSDDTPVNVSV